MWGSHKTKENKTKCHQEASLYTQPNSFLIVTCRYINNILYQSYVEFKYAHLTLDAKGFSLFKTYLLSNFSRPRFAGNVKLCVRERDHYGLHKRMLRVSSSQEKYGVIQESIKIIQESILRLCRSWLNKIMQW